MDEREVERCWERITEAWTALARAGYDVHRDKANTPVPDVDGLKGLDVGCGEGLIPFEVNRPRPHERPREEVLDGTVTDPQRRGAPAELGLACEPVLT